MIFVSAYCGGLWLAALYSIVQIAKILKQEDVSEKYLIILNKAKESFNAILWNGNFFIHLLLGDHIFYHNICNI